MESINSRPRPRLLVIDRQSNIAEAKTWFTSFPTVEYIEGVNDLHTVDQTEYDVAVVLDENLSNVGLNKNLIVLHVGTSGLIFDQRFDNLYYRLYVGESFSVAKELAVPSELKANLKNLITRTLLPIYQGENSHYVLSSHVLSGAHLRENNKLWVPLVADQNGVILAGYYEVKEGGKHWWLPPGLNYAVINEWLTLLIDEQWKVAYPKRFPTSNEEWQSMPEWMTKREREVRADITRTESSLQEYITRHASLIKSKDEELVIAKDNADKGIRQLLTKQGSDLKETVKTQLEGLGFIVEDADEELAEKGDLLEDLRLRFGNGTQVLIEVRGYKKGARLSDLLRLGRFEKRYMKENEGREPRALWYIVNHDFNSHPAKRTTALAEHPNEVDEFSKANGLVIDTVELFRLVQAVDLGILDKEAACARLLETKGTFKA